MWPGSAYRHRVVQRANALDLPLDRVAGSGVVETVVDATDLVIAVMVGQMTAPTMAAGCEAFVQLGR
jgi:predicted RNA-binding protein associated with RNAse of E/G family